MKLPQKIYVALRYDSELVRGFMAVADKEQTKYCQAAKQKVDGFAGAHRKSMYITNEAREGFRVIDYTSDGMLIEHPEGFSFFITPRNMYDLIRTCTIVNGEIDNKLYFSDTLALISEVSEILSDVLNAEETLAKQKELLKSMKFNDTFEYGNYKSVMIGRYHFLRSTSYGTEVNSSSKLMYVFMNLKTGQYYAESSPLPNLIAGVTQENHFTGTEQEELDKALAYFKSVDMYGRPKFNYLAVSSKPIKPSNLKSKFVPCPLDKIEVSKYYPRISVIANDDGTYSHFDGFRTLQENGYRWSSKYKVVKYETVDDNKDKFYNIRNMSIVDGIYTINGMYNEDEASYIRFNCPVNELDINAGYLEFYL